MCNTDVDAAQIWNLTNPTARKQHRCFECDGAIPPGERYLRIGCLFDGRWDTYRMHGACEAMWNFIIDEVCGGQGMMVAGGLREEITAHDLDRAVLDDDGESVEGPTPADIYKAFIAHYAADAPTEIVTKENGK